MSHVIIHKIVIDAESDNEGSEPEIDVDNSDNQQKNSDNQQEIGEKSSNSETKRIVKRGTRLSYTISDKLVIVARRENGESAHQICEETGIW